MFSLTSCEKLEVGRIICIGPTEIQSIGQNSAIAKSSIIDRGEGIETYGHCWSDIPLPLITDRHTVFHNSFNNEEFSSKIDSLEPGIVYYIRPYVTSNQQVTYGKPIEIKLDHAAPVAVTLKTINYGINHALIRAVITAENSKPVSESGFVLGSDSKLKDGFKVNSPYNDSDTIEYTWSNLMENERYYYAAYVSNSDSTVFGDTLSFKTDLLDIPMVFVEGGSFEMGNEDGNIDQQPVHPVFISDFRISAFEITNEQFCTFMNTTTADHLGRIDNEIYVDIPDEDCQIYSVDNEFIVIPGYEDHPVREVSWQGAMAYCQYYGYRLPTEAEWEYVAKKGSSVSNLPHMEGIRLEETGWYIINSGNSTHKVGEKEPNSLGIYDLTGNVSEWCSDWYDAAYYSLLELSNPTGSRTGKDKVIRGGNWNSTEAECSLTRRNFYYYRFCNAYTGFRIVIDVENVPE